MPHKLYRNTKVSFGVTGWASGGVDLHPRLLCTWTAMAAARARSQFRFSSNLRERNPTLRGGLHLVWSQLGCGGSHSSVAWERAEFFSTAFIIVCIL